MRRITVKGFFKRLSLGMFLTCAAVILAESAVDGTSSADKSNAITNIVQDVIDSNHDSNTIVDIHDFNLSFNNEQYKDIYNPGDILTYETVFEPSSTSFIGLNITSSNQEIAKINPEEKKISFLKAGEVIINAVSTAKEELKHSYPFKVEDIYMTSIQLEESDITLYEGDTYQTNPSYEPTNATDIGIKYSSSDPNIAQVDESYGLIKAISPGQCDILVTYISNEKVYTTLHVNVQPLESINYEINSLSVKDDLGVISLNQTSLKIALNYNSIHAPFDEKLLEIKFDKNPDFFSISKKELISAGFFQFVLSLNTTNSSVNTSDDFTSNIKISYDKKIEATTKVTFKKLLKINYNHVKQTQQNYEFYYTKYLQYETTNYIIKDDANIQVKFIDSFKYKEYDLKNFKWEIDPDISSAFKIISKSYSTIKLQPLSNVVVGGYVKYYPDKNLNESVQINFTYENTSSDSKITDINLLKFNNEEENTLILNHEYKSFFLGKITANGSNAKNNNYLENSKILYKIDDGEKVEIFTNEETGTLSLVPKKEGNLSITIYSQIEDTLLDYENSIKKVYEFKIKPYLVNYAKLMINETEYDFSDIPTRITLNREEAMTFSLNSFYNQTFQDGTSELINIENDFTFEIFNNDNSVYKIEDTSTIIGIKASETNDLYIKLASRNYPDFSVKIYVDVLYIPIKLESFSMKFEVLEETTINTTPTENFDKVAINTKFKAIPILNEDATHKDVSFYSSDEEIIKISQKSGIAKANKAGKCTISILSNDNPNIKIEKEIEVKNIASDFIIEKTDTGFNPLSLKEVKDDEGNHLFYEAELDYGRPYNLQISPLSITTSSDISYSHVDYYGNEIKDTVVSIDKSGSITTSYIGDDWIKVTFGKEDSLTNYTKYIKIKVLRNTFFTYTQLGYIVRKSLGHFGLFALTAVFSVFFILLAFNRNLYRVFALLGSFMLGVFLAISSELIQSITPGRYCTVQDMFIDSMGYLLTILCAIGFIILTVIIKRIYRYYKKRKQQT